MKQSNCFISSAVNKSIGKIDNKSVDTSIYTSSATDIVECTDNISTNNIYLTPYPIESEIYEPINNYEEINA